jgi:hypothetical protein
MSWLKVPEADPRFPKWLKRENLVHDFNRVLWLNDTCERAVVCLEGLAPKEDHGCEYEDERDFRLVSAMGR